MSVFEKEDDGPKINTQPLFPENPSYENIRDWLRRTDELRNIYNEWLNFSLKPHTSKETKEQEKRFAGYIFEFLGFNYLSNAIVGETEQLLSPRETVAYYFSKIARKPIIVNSPGTYGQENTPVPDGLVIAKRGRNGAVRQIVEYTATGAYLYFRYKYRWYQEAKQNLPSIFEGAQITFVTPEFETNTPSILARDDVRHITLPFTHGQFREIVDESIFLPPHPYVIEDWYLTTKFLTRNSA